MESFDNAAVMIGEIIITSHRKLAVAYCVFINVGRPVSYLIYNNKTCVMYDYIKYMYIYFLNIPNCDKKF